MAPKNMPGITKELIERINLVRRDIGNLLFHFTKTPDKQVVINIGNLTKRLGKTPGSVLDKILAEGCLIGTKKWIKGRKNCICFTEAPISEIAALFSLVKIAASKAQRPRYEPYGVAVTKEWLYGKGGRPVIYDMENAYRSLPKEL